MSEDQDIVKAVFVVLSKLRGVGGDRGSSRVEGLRDLEKALELLAALCDGKERNEVVEWSGRVVSARSEIESLSSEIKSEIRSFHAPIEAGVIDILMRRLPKGKRDEVRTKLAKILDEWEDLNILNRVSAEGDQSIQSGLEEKLKMLENDERARGLDRFLEDDGQN